MTWWQIILTAFGGWFLLSYLFVGALTVRGLRTAVLMRDLTWREWFVGLFGWPRVMVRLLRFERQLMETLHYVGH